MVPAIGLLLLSFPTLLASSDVAVELFVASKCPDAARCENTFLPEVLRRVGSIVDLQVNFMGAADPAAPLGAACLHGESECEGNAVQLCVQRHFPDNHDIESLGRHSWTSFLGCVGHFNSTSQSQIPGNTDACLASLGVPADSIDRIRACARGPEGRQMLAESVRRTAAVCGAHSEEPRKGCKSCAMFLQGQEGCVEDGFEWYNCSVGHDASSWVAAICAAYQGPDRPLACDLAGGGAVPRVVGHSYGSVDPAASADFAVRYFQATLLEQSSSHAEVQLPRFDDFRGGGLVLRFVRPQQGGSSSSSSGGHLAQQGDFGVADFVRSMEILAGNLSDNTGYQWNQFFDNHLGFYVPDQAELAARFVREDVPFFTTIDSGYYQSIYVLIPGTGSLVELLGNFATEPPLPLSHVRVESTQQFCTPFGGRGRGAAREDGGRHPQRRLRIPGPGDADMNKTTWAAPDPDAVVRFAAAFLGAAPIHQRRGPVADGQCAKLSWARWPDGHEWHVVNTFSTDWVTRDHLAPAVPFNISGFAAHVEGLRDLARGQYDDFLDYRDILETSDLAPVERRLRASGVPFLTSRGPSSWSSLFSPQRRSLVVGLPGGLAVEVREPAAAGAAGAAEEEARRGSAAAGGVFV